ncbi:non-receptor protein kinase [Aphelenchoides avenae]|nr:non-receptor protein kinase [Aphelenchus avenae]
MQLPSWLLLICVSLVLISRIRAQCPPQMSSACECQAVNENVRWTCTDDFDQSKVAFSAAQNYSIAEVTSLQKVTKLNQLNLNGNKISTIPKKALLVTQLQDLRLERNSICDIAINALKEAGASSPQWQRLLTVPATNLRPLRRLMYLDLAGNQIAELPPLTFHTFPHLVKLRLTKNKMMQLTANTFSSLPKLEELVLRENQLSVIEDSAFQGTPGLQKNLGHNELAKVR